MNRYTRLIAFLLCSIMPFTFTYSSFFDDFDELDKIFERQRQSMKKEFTEMKDMLRKSADNQRPRMNMVMEKQDCAMAFKWNNLETDGKELNAEFNNQANTLTIRTSAGTIKLMARGNYLSVQYSYEEKDKDKQESFYVASGTSQIGKTLDGRPHLADANINYNPEEKSLTILVPVEETEIQKKQVTKIPVHVK